MQTIIRSISFFLFVLLAGTATAQHLKIGPRVGATLYKIDNVAFTDEFNWGFHAGGFIEAMWSKKWGIQPEVLFNQSNTQTATRFDQLYQSINPGVIKDVKLNYLSIPVLLNWRPVNFLTFQAGPQFSVLMQKDRNLLDDGKAAFTGNNVSLLGGVQLNIFQFRVYGRYGLGLSNVNNVNNSERWNSQGIQIGAGFTF